MEDNIRHNLSIACTMGMDECDEALAYLAAAKYKKLSISLDDISDYLFDLKAVDAKVGPAIEALEKLAAAIYELDKLPASNKALHAFTVGAASAYLRVLHDVFKDIQFKL